LYFKLHPVLRNCINTKFKTSEATNRLTISQVGICLIITVCYCANELIYENILNLFLNNETAQKIDKNYLLILKFEDRDNIKLPEIITTLNPMPCPYIPYDIRQKYRKNVFCPQDE
jgi:hypothetical protein